jgi:hypothetical protein
MLTYTITHNFGQCPNQISGTTDDGRHFYFRGRGGSWSLGFGATDDKAVENCDFEGDLLRAGWMELDEWEAFFWDVIENVVEKGREPATRANDVERYQAALKAIHNEIHAKASHYSIPVDEAVKIIRKHDPDRMF